MIPFLFESQFPFYLLQCFLIGCQFKFSCKTRANHIIIQMSNIIFAVECRNDSTVSKMQCSVVVHEPTLTFTLRSLMNSSPRRLFNGDGLDVHLGILFLAVNCLLTFFFPKELSQPLHLHISEHGEEESSRLPRSRSQKPRSQ